MKSARYTFFSGILLVAVVATWSLARAEIQATGTPGSPGATTTIDGRYLPPPPQQFHGDIQPNAYQSKPYWPELVTPPKGAPNILLIMTDDVGFSAPEHIRRLDSDTGTGSRGRAGFALHPVPYHGALLADAGCVAHRPQPPLGGHRRRCGPGDRLPRLQQRHPA